MQTGPQQERLHLDPETTAQPNHQQHHLSVLQQLEPLPTHKSPLKPNALEHDIRLGWLPRSQITGPIPLSFAHDSFDWVIESKQNSLLYLGFRPSTTFALHQRFYNAGQNYPFHQFHLAKAQFLDRFFRKHYSDYTFQGREQATLGQNSLQFDSAFEGGNLDAVYLEEGVYCLLLRVDSNTLGHCNYYNFKVVPAQSGKQVFLIMNMSKPKSLYQRGMRPYVCKLKPGQEFEQGGTNVKFIDSPLMQQFELPNKHLKALKFEYEFDEPGMAYQFSYSIPYTYSQLYSSVRSLTSQSVHLSKLCYSLSGVQIPLLTVSSPEEALEQHKYVIVILGRVHPSEATGSHIVNGLIKALTGQTKEAKQLRNKAIFKIIPMLNPDGVILGNTRTGVAGKDLNRQYRKNTQFIFPEVTAVIDYVNKLKNKYGKKVLFLLDIHGHSARKNSFFFGPQYPIMDQEYARCRLLPKLLAARTDVFRYYSCKFKVSSCKETTARGYFNQQGLRTYTHETSAHCFFDFEQRRDQPFNRAHLEALGTQLLFSIADYLTHIASKEVISLPQLSAKVSQAQQQVANRSADPEEGDSEKISSNGDDSQSSAQDFQEGKQQQFFRRINENKQYFYEELLALQQSNSQTTEEFIREEKKKNIQKGKADSKESMHRLNAQQGLEDEVLLKHRGSQKRVDWVAKAAYPEKKRTFQEYTKLSSVIFGSSIPSHFFGVPSESSPGGPTESEDKDVLRTKTKYSVNYIEAKFQSTQTRHSPVEPKVHRSLKSIKPTLRDSLSTFFRDPLRNRASQFDSKARERYLKLKQELLPRREEMNRRDELAHHRESVLSRVPVCSVGPGVQVTESKDVMCSTSLRMLPRKKSIKNMRESELVVNRRASKHMRSGSLTKQLPSLGRLWVGQL